MRAQSRPSHPMDGDTKPCPKCHGILVFVRHSAVPREDLLMDIGTEELGHLEKCGRARAVAPEADEVRPPVAERDPLIAMAS